MINIFTERTEQALKTHRKKLKVDLIERLKRRLGKNENELIRGQYEKLVSFLENNVEEIIGGKIKDVILLQIKLYDKLGYSEALRGDLEYVFNYKWFRSSKKKYDGFKLAKELAIDVCPYCNRNYTTSHRIDGTLKNVFPEFDHFYPQKDFPLLALSFYNLIPSCSICNSHYKKGENPDLRNIYYPYSSYIAVKYFNFEFTPLDYASLLGKSMNFETSINTIKYLSAPKIRQKVEGTLDFFKIVSNYQNNHKNLIEGIINKRINNSDSYIKSLEGYGVTKEEAYQILFESYYEDDKLLKRPFSKLKKDIFDEIESLI